MPVKTSKAGSIKALRASVERKGGGNEAFLQRVPADDSIMVRFLTEPDEWQSYFEHYDPVMRYYPCSDNCPGCTEGNRPSQRYLANVLDIENDRVVPLVIAKSLVTKLLNSYDRYKTMTDRDFELIRLGSGLDTDYDRSPEAPSTRAIDRYPLLDLEEVLENQLRRAFDDESGEEPKASKNGAGKRGGAPHAKAPTPEPVEEDSATVLEVDLEELEQMSLRELRAYATSEVGIPKEDIRGLDQDALLDLINDRVKGKEDDGDDEDDSDVDAEDTATEEADDDGDEELTEEQIRAMSIADLRKLCTELEIAWKRTDGKATLIKAILESVPDEDEDDGAPPF